jgi:hypothetical protein
VVVNELMWMGSYDNSGTGYTDDEFIELWNKTGSAINISFWQLSGTGINAVTLPPGQSIPANGYYVIARNNLNAFPMADYYKSSTLGLSGTTLQVELRTSLNTLIDTANNGGAPFAGLNDTGAQIRRSMERRPTATDGTLAASWVTAGVVGSNVAAGFSTKTIATPRQANSFYVQSAVATSSTSITVQFNVAPTSGSGATGAENIANYSIPGLSISAASLSGDTVTLTTSAQTPLQNYTLTVNNVTASGSNAPVSPNTANFTGFVTMATVIINEVAPAEASSKDLIELYAVTGGSLNGLEIFEGSTSLKVLPNVIVAAGDYIVIHINATGTDETSSKSESADTGHIPTAWDYWSSDAGLTATDNAIILKNSSSTILDACIYGNNSGGWTGPTISTVIDPVIAAGQWTKAGVTFVESDAINHAGTIPAGSSFRRTPNGNDTNNSAADWTSGAGLTIGSANP